MASADPPKWSRRPPPPEPAAPRRRSLLLLLLLLAGASLYGLWWRERTPPPPTPHQAAPPAAAVPLRYVTLFYGTPSGDGLSGIVRQRPECSAPEVCALDLLQALADLPDPGYTPVLPPQAVIRGVTFHGDLAVIDLSRETVNRLPGGSLNELLFVTSLADTLAVNFPHIRQISLLVDGTNVNTLKGHLDLSQPFLADFALMRGSSAPPPRPPAGGDHRQE